MLAFVLILLLLLIVIIIIPNVLILYHCTCSDDLLFSCKHELTLTSDRESGSWKIDSCNKIKQTVVTNSDEIIL